MIFKINKKVEDRIRDIQNKLSYILSEEGLIVEENFAINQILYRGLEGKVSGEIHNFDYKNYTYKNALIEVEYFKKKIDGRLHLDDDNGSISLAGFYDQSNRKMPELKLSADVSDVQLGKLNLAKNMDNSYLSFSVDANFIGNSIDNAEGYLLLDSLELFKDQQFFELDYF